MLSVVTEFTVAAPNRDAFERNFTASMHATLVEVPGLQRAQLLRPDGEGRPYLAIMEFDDEQAYTAYTSSARFRAAHDQPKQSVADGHRVTNYQAVTQITG